MYKIISSILFTTTVGFFFLLIFGSSTVNANHSWGNYHWARTGNPFNLRLGDNVSLAWDSYLNTSSSDWSISSVLDTSIVAGGTNARRCRPTNGRVEVCNYRYGRNGWLGLAQIWVNNGHIYQGVVKANDTYFNTSTYNTSAWKNLVMCQEIGHTLGLDHQDEIFENPPLGTCMDYSSDPVPNQHPNQHDYDQLDLIYSHLDSLTTAKSTLRRAFALGEFPNRSDWGKLLKDNGRIALFERDFGGGHKLFTYIIWDQK
ncbi:MAG: hypothetical protein HYT08_02915 [Candidatus Levybacteria bacterium]|nr:hypothetical protein [Candidatus Levybacteria bacterium]